VISALPEDIVPWMAGHGWTATAKDARDLLADHGRTSPSRDPARPPSWLIDGRR
jgi:O-methyltransferase involved in polyketide biosynthesis